MRHITDLFVDLDGTLYPIKKDNDYEHHVRQNVFKFMHQKLNVPEDQCYEIWKKEFSKYNQSLKGLREYGFKFDVDDYWQFIRQGAEDFLTADPEVKELFKILPQRKWLFTNANEKSARECLKILDLEGIFDGIIGADAMGEICKPEKAAFDTALQISGADPTKSAMFEDSFKNLKTAKELGMTTILIWGGTATEEDVTRRRAQGVVDVLISKPSVKEIRGVLPDLLRNVNLGESGGRLSAEPEALVQDMTPA